MSTDLLDDFAAWRLSTFHTPECVRHLEDPGQPLPVPTARRSRTEETHAVRNCTQPQGGRMKVKTSPYERAINRLAQGTPKDCDLADELEAAVRRDMRERLAVSEAVHAAVAAEREACARVAETFPDRTQIPGWIADAIRARGGK